MIKPGDIVMLVWACCPEAREYIGLKGVVRQLPSDDPGPFTCRQCGGPRNLTHATLSVDGAIVLLPVAWLAKDDPPGVETEKREEVEADA